MFSLCIRVDYIAIYHIPQSHVKIVVWKNVSRCRPRRPPRGLGNGLRAPLHGLLRTKSHIEFSKNYAGFIPILSSISSASLTSNLWLETKKFLANVKEARNGRQLRSSLVKETWRNSDPARSFFGARSPFLPNGVKEGKPAFDSC